MRRATGPQLRFNRHHQSKHSTCEVHFRALLELKKNYSMERIEVGAWNISGRDMLGPTSRHTAPKHASLTLVATYGKFTK